jgi:hypothetical protein
MNNNKNEKYHAAAGSKGSKVQAILAKSMNYTERRVPMTISQSSIYAHAPAVGQYQLN